MFVSVVGLSDRWRCVCVLQVSELTMMYNDESPLENLHARTTFECLKEPGCNVLENLEKNQWHDARRIVCHSILHTDMSKHPDTVAMLKSRKVSTEAIRCLLVMSTPSLERLPVTTGLLTERGCRPGGHVQRCAACDGPR